MASADQPAPPANTQPPLSDALAQAAIAFVRPGMTVGLGTGRAAARFVRALADAASRQQTSFTCVSTSEATTTLAASLGLRVVALADVRSIDVLVDGADEVDPQCRMIKGGGGAMTRERIVAHVASRCVYIVDEAKLSQRLGAKRLLPVEVVPLAAASVERALGGLGLRAAGAEHGAAGQSKAIRRKAASGGDASDSGAPFVTDNHGWVLDVELDVRSVGELEELDASVKRLPGVIDHGLFLKECHTLLIEDASGGVRTLMPLTGDRSKSAARS